MRLSSTPWLICLAVALCGSAPPVARAQPVHVDLRVGALTVHDAGDSELRPRVEVALGFPVVGPLEAGVRASAVAERLPLLHPTFGLATGLGLRPNFERFPLAPLLEVYAGRARFSTSQGGAAAWTLDGAAGLRLRVVPRVSVEARVARHLLFGLPTASPLSDRAWSASLGLSADW